MKRFLPLLIVLVAFVSCQEDVKFSNPGFQGLKDDVMWRANSMRASVSSSGALKIEALKNFETVTLNTSSAAAGTYLLGTSNTSNSATYSWESSDLINATGPVPGPAGVISLVSGGTNYSSSTSVPVEGGSGSGMTVNIVANASKVVTSATISSRGNGYLAGDIVTVAGIDGDHNCKLRIDNVQNSNGEIQILEYDNVNMTVSGKFKFNAGKIDSETSGEPILNFQYGEFYKIPVYPNP